MLTVIIGSALGLLLAIIGIFNQDIRQTIAAGVEHAVPATTTWPNPFLKTSWIDLADASVALFADHIIPAVVPGSTGTGRPYVVDLAGLADLTTNLNSTMVDTSDPLVPFTGAQVICGVLLVIFVLSVLVVIGCLSFWSFYTGIGRKFSELETATSGLHGEMSRSASLAPFFDRLCQLTKSGDLKTMREPLSQLNTELRATGQVPCLPGLTTHIDFVLHTIDSANDQYKASVEAKKLLDAKTEKLNETSAQYNEILIIHANLAGQYNEKIKDLESGDSKLREITVSRRELQNAFNAKVADHEELAGKVTAFEKEILNGNANIQALQNSLDDKAKEYDATVKQLQLTNTKCNGLETALTNVQANLQGANDRCGDLEVALKAANGRWDAFANGPSSIEDAFNTPLPEPVDGELDPPQEDTANGSKPVPSSAPANNPSTPGLNPAAQSFGPVRYPRTWRTDEQAKEVHNQLIALQRAQLTGQVPATGGRGLPLIPRRNSMGSVSNGATSFPRGSFATPATPIASTGPKSGNATDDAKPAPIPAQGSEIPPVPATPNGSAPSSVPTPQRRDSSAPEPAGPRGRSSGTSTPPNSEPRSRTPTTAQRIDGRPTASPQGPPRNHSHSSPIRTSTTPTPSPSNGPGNPSPFHPSGQTPQPSRASSQGFTPSHRGGGYPSPRGPGPGRGSYRGRGRGDSKYFDKNGRDIRTNYDQSDFMVNLLAEGLPGQKNGPPAL
ncbi:MAG: hypothetical protein Q9168_005946 [Polycauliona sp. 1 TL-2023]